MCFTFKKNSKWTKKPVNCFLQDDASAAIRSLQTCIVTKLCRTPGNGLQLIKYQNTIRNAKISLHQESNPSHFKTGLNQPPHVFLSKTFIEWSDRDEPLANSPFYKLLGNFLATLRFLSNFYKFWQLFLFQATNGQLLWFSARYEQYLSQCKKFRLRDTPVDSRGGLWNFYGARIFFLKFFNKPM